MSQTKECLGPSVLHDFKVLKKSECYRTRTITLCGPTGGTDNSDWYKDNLGNRNLDKIKIKKKDLFYLQILLNTDKKEAFKI
jgi:hypothetical protein